MTGAVLGAMYGGVRTLSPLNADPSARSTKRCFSFVVLSVPTTSHVTVDK